MGTHYKGSLIEENSLNSYIKLIRAYESLSSRLYLKLNKKGLTQSQFYLLDALYHLGSMNQKDLAKKISRSEGNITMVVNNLAKRKLIKKQKNEEDKRIYIINLTNAGTILYEKVFPKFLETIVFEFNSLKGKQHKEFQKICKKIGYNPF